MAVVNSGKCPCYRLCPARPKARLCRHSLSHWLSVSLFWRLAQFLLRHWTALAELSDVYFKFHLMFSKFILCFCLFIAFETILEHHYVTWTLCKPFIHENVIFFTNNSVFISVVSSYFLQTRWQVKMATCKNHTFVKNNDYLSRGRCFPLFYEQTLIPVCTFVDWCSMPPMIYLYRRR